MIEKLDWEKDNWIAVIDKINEIIDHLPQEKEDYLQVEPTVRDLEVEPTKEVPDIRIVDTNILWQKLQDRGFDHVQASEAIKVIQEISALYRKEK